MPYTIASGLVGGVCAIVNERRNADEQRRSNEIDKNKTSFCMNCGAPRISHKCQYCNTLFRIPFG